uniref:transducin-like enhancer protein 6 isoform X1 n=1 Tax=Panthera onca TaxID=9690 RepID=UPI002954979D|nr:transducin-like enhancer protein 6 isoform X1 [Panthera onca]
MTSWDHLRPQEHPQGLRRPPGTLASPELNSPDVLDQLRRQFPRLPPHLTAQVESTYHAVSPTGRPPGGLASRVWGPPLLRLFLLPLGQFLQGGAS